MHPLKPHTGNQSMQFDEEIEAGKPLFYSTGLKLTFDTVKILDEIEKLLYCHYSQCPSLVRNPLITPLAAQILFGYSSVLHWSCL
jgi:hypothetical protein